ncbi:MAG: hypothetical protein WD775_08900 [Burkholderiales bacterium]
MTSESGKIGSSEGERKIRDFCLRVAAEIGLKVDHTSWALDFVAEPKQYILSVYATDGATSQISFTWEEVDGYAKGRGVDSTNEKVKKELNEMLDV